ncbi:MAG: hypothetical protein J6Q58_00175 [Clostridia bacterium]|nr:hypothetical protein [Clostridia bacterium]
MNVLFSLIVLLSIFLIIFKDPNILLTAFSSGTKNAIELSITLLAVYAVWLGINEILKESGANKALSKALKYPIKKLFRTNDDKAIELLSLSISSNIFGLGGIATPISIDAMARLDEKKSEHAKTMLFVVSSTSIQLFPITVMQLLSELNAPNPAIIFLPTLISTLISTTIGVLLVKIFQ